MINVDVIKPPPPNYSIIATGPSGHQQNGIMKRLSYIFRPAPMYTSRKAPFYIFNAPQATRSLLSLGTVALPALIL